MRVCKTGSDRHIGFVIPSMGRRFGVAPVAPVAPACVFNELGGATGSRGVALCGPSACEVGSVSESMTRIRASKLVLTAGRPRGP